MMGELTAGERIDPQEVLLERAHDHRGHGALEELDFEPVVPGRTR